MSAFKLRRFRFLIPMLMLSMVFVVACDTEDDPTEDSLDPTATTDPLGTPDGTTPQTTATPDDATPATTPDDSQAPEAGGEDMIEVSITGSEVAVTPASAMGDDVTVRILNDTDVERDIVIVRLGEDDPDVLDWFGDDGQGEFDSTGLDVVEEATVDAMGEHEFSPDVADDEGEVNFVIVTTGAEGAEALWGEFSVQADGAGTGMTDGTGPTNGTGTN